jgi:hypothetical protein
MFSFPAKKARWNSRVRTYPTSTVDNVEARLAVLHDEALKSPAPVPMDLDTGLTSIKVETGSSKLLVPKIRAVVRRNLLAGGGMARGAVRDGASPKLSTKEVELA